MDQTQKNDFYLKLDSTIFQVTLQELAEKGGTFDLTIEEFSSLNQRERAGVLLRMEHALRSLRAQR